jgi:hypothetical protein
MGEDTTLAGSFPAISTRSQLSLSMTGDQPVSVRSFARAGRDRLLALLGQS